MPDAPAATGNLKYTAHGFDTELSLMVFDEDILHFRHLAKCIMLPSLIQFWLPEFTDKTLSRKTG
ncbi:hypothetical protein FHZ12_21670 [Salmonella enterica]|nr:hypothetical protein [Salmonella enterica]